MKRIACLTMISLLALGSSPQRLAAQQASEEEAEIVEPLLIDEALPNEPGESSLRISAGFLTADDETAGVAPRLQLFHGLPGRVGVEASLPLAFHREDDERNFGLGDIGLGLKLLAVEHGEAHPAVALGFETEFPTGDEDEELGEGENRVRPFIALLKDFGAFSLQGNVGWEKQTSGDDREDQFDYNWALAVPLVPARTHLLAELSGDWSRAPERIAAIGLKQQVSDSATFGVTIPFGLNNRTEDWGVHAQLQFEF